MSEEKDWDNMTLDELKKEVKKNTQWREISQCLLAISLFVSLILILRVMAGM